MREAAKVLYLSLYAGATQPRRSSSGSATTDKMTAEDEVLLLHVLE